MPCKVSTCKSLTKKSEYSSQCRRCALNRICWQHNKEEYPDAKATRKWHQAATVGNGVAVKESTIKGSGLGLFATWAFRSSDIITEYAGPRISTSQAKQRSVQTHLKRLAPGVIINGLRTPKKGAGGGSFANHSAEPNARFHDDNNSMWLRATKVIKPGEEILISYGRHGSPAWLVAMGLNAMR